MFAGTSHHWTPSKLLKRLADGNVPIEQWAACRKSYSHLWFVTTVQLHYMLKGADLKFLDFTTKILYNRSSF